MSKAETVKKTQMIIIGACLLITAIVTFFTVRHYQSAQQSRHLYDRQKMRLDQLIKDIKDTQSATARLKIEQEEFRKLLFDERDVPAFIDGISASADKSSVFVVGMKTQQFAEVAVSRLKINGDGKVMGKGLASKVERTVKNDLKEQLREQLTLAAMPIDIKIQGTFQAIADFLNSIENYKQLLTVSNVEITYRSDYPQLDCNFTLRIYSIKQLKDIKP